MWCEWHCVDNIFTFDREVGLRNVFRWNAVGWKISACGPPTASLCRTNAVVKQAWRSPSTLRSLASWVCCKTFKLEQRNWRKKKFWVKLPLKIYNTKNLILIGDMNFNSSWCLLQSSSNFNDFCRNGEWGRPRLRRSVWLLSRNKVECGATRRICNYPKVITYLWMS